MLAEITEEVHCMKKTYITTMPDHIGAFLNASECFASLGVNITRVSYNKAVDSHTLFIDAEGDRTRLESVLRFRSYEAYKPAGGKPGCSSGKLQHCDAVVG